MNYKNLIKIALRALNNNKFRGFLTMLGIIIGVASVIAMLAIGQGSKRSIRAQISEMGSNMIMIHPGGDMRGGVRRDPASMQTLKIEDYQDIATQTTYVDKCSPSVSSSGQVIYGANNAPTSVYGVNEEYLDIRKYSVGQGDMFTPADIKSSAKVCIVGQTVVDNLFKNGEDPIGKVIRFNKIPFRIIGVLTAKGYNSMGMDQDDLIIAPYTTIQKRVLAITYLQSIYASAVRHGYRRDKRDIAHKPQTEGCGRRRFHGTFAGRAEFHAQFDYRYDDGASGLYCGYIVARGRHRHYEHNVCFGHGAYPRDRLAHVHRGKGPPHTDAVPYRSGDNKHCRRGDRRRIGRRRFGGDKVYSRLAGLRSVVVGGAVVCRMFGYGYFLRVVPGAEGFGAGSDRSPALRINDFHGAWGAMKIVAHRCCICSVKKLP